MVVSGMRESEQPSQRMDGDWPFAEVGKKEGEEVWRSVAQRWLASRATLKALSSFSAVVER